MNLFGGRDQALQLPGCGIYYPYHYVIFGQSVEVEPALGVPFGPNRLSSLRGTPTASSVVFVPGIIVEGIVRPLRGISDIAVRCCRSLFDSIRAPTNPSGAISAYWARHGAELFLAKHSAISFRESWGKESSGKSGHPNSMSLRPNPRATRFYCPGTVTVTPHPAPPSLTYHVSQAKPEGYAFLLS